MNSYLSARTFIGLPVLATNDHTLGTVETWVIDPKSMVIDGILVGKTSQRGQSFLPFECITSLHESFLYAHERLITQPKASQRILGLPARTTSPRFLAGFVYDCFFHPDSARIESFVIHQLVRTWRVPAGSVESITPTALLIDTDTTIRLKLTPYPNPSLS